MYRIEIVVNGRRMETVQRERLAEFTSLLSTYRQCGWTVAKHDAYNATASRVV